MCLFELTVMLRISTGSVLGATTADPPRTYCTGSLIAGNSLSPFILDISQLSVTQQSRRQSSTTSITPRGTFRSLLTPAMLNGRLWSIRPRLAKLTRSTYLQQMPNHRSTSTDFQRGRLLGIY